MSEQVKITKPFKPIINKQWLKIFNEIDEDVWDITEEYYNELMEKNPNVFPIYSQIFNFTNLTAPDEIKVVIIGQDPYHGLYKDTTNNTYYPEAMGLSFSVPSNCHIPSSLKNIYKNLELHNHIYKHPDHGNLTYWAYQGVLMINSALTVEKSKPNSCQYMWTKFTDELLKIISKKYKGIVFLLWGKYAHYKKVNNIIANQDKHYFVISSHPSGYSANSPYREFKSFMETDHFGLANEYLIKQNKTPIDWQII